METDEMGGRIKDVCVHARWIVMATAVVVIGAGCATPPRNPFGQFEGSIYLTFINNSRRPVTAVLVGLGEPISLGAFLGGETRFMEFQIEGRGDISMRLSSLNGGDTYETFRTRAKPGDRFLVEVGNDLRLARLIRTRVP